MENSVLASVCVRTEARVMERLASAPARPAGLGPPVSEVRLRLNLIVR